MMNIYNAELIRNFPRTAMALTSLPGKFYAPPGSLYLADC